ncbi:hypothetical protein AB0E27_35505, partial [Streptomyces sparsogenes]
MSCHEDHKKQAGTLAGRPVGELVIRAVVTFAQLKALDPARFERAADGWHKVSSSASAAKDRLENEINAKLRGGLKGQGVGAALGRLERLSENFHYMQVECALVLTALNGLAA